MPKYLMLKHYRGAPARRTTSRATTGRRRSGPTTSSSCATSPSGCRTPGSSSPADALAPEGTWVRFDGEGRPPVTDGPFAETKDLIAGWMIIDVASYDRALELAGELSSGARRGRQAAGRVAGAAAGDERAADRHGVTDADLRAAVPQVLAALVRRGADFAAAEDAVQDALVEGLRTWAADPPRDVRAWLVTVAWRRYLDAVRSDVARQRREGRGGTRRGPGRDDSLQLYFLCAHPSLTPSSAVALTLRGRRRRRAHDPADRPGLPGARGDDGAADQPGQEGRSPASGWTRRGTSPPCCGRCTWCSTRATAGTSTWSPRRSASPGSCTRTFDHPEVAGLLALMLLPRPAVRPGSRRTARWCRSRSRTGACGTPG